MVAENKTQVGAAAALAGFVNGPLVAGIGATVDPGLPREKYHVIPWDPTPVIWAPVTEGANRLMVDETARWTAAESAAARHEAAVKAAGGGAAPDDNYSYPADADFKQFLKYAINNVDNVFGFAAVANAYAGIERDFKDRVRADMIAIVFMLLSCNQYDKECIESSVSQDKAIEATPVSDEAAEGLINTESVNRAATFILARMHTKYQTNHAIGGSPMQASMASAVRAFYSVTPGAARSDSARTRVEFISKCLYWAVHPANETLLIPSVIHDTGMKKARIHALGPPTVVIEVEEYFKIRAHTPPASTHHFYVAASAIRQLAPLGILPYMPDVGRFDVVVSGLSMIATHGAALHPAARFWGLERVTSDQKRVETICADLGYAVKKLLPASSLASSPILGKEDGLNPQWKTFVDNLRQTFDEKGKELLDEGILRDLKAKLAPSVGHIEGLAAIEGFLATGRMIMPASKPASETDAPAEEEGN